VSGAGTGADEPRRYRVDVSDTAEQEADTVYLWMQTNRGLSQADRWYRGLYQAYQSLTTFPNRFEAVPHRQDVRRMLYGQYRVLYRVIEPDVPEEEGIVRILRVLHGARQTESDADNGS
jgi:plasmid stabilization system protein ParE